RTWRDHALRARRNRRDRTEVDHPGGCRDQGPPTAPTGHRGRALRNDSLIMAGFIDCHVHFPQIPIIGAGGAQLLDWLEKYTFIAEQRFEQPKHSRDVARVFLQESLRNGVTTARTVSPLAL